MGLGRKSRVGRVVSNKMDKTVVVEVEYRRRHPLYKKVMRKRRRFFAHDEANSCQEGDLVRIVETRPLSRKKRWRVAEIVERAA
jgi:small subunit ribosomal protein S17